MNADRFSALRQHWFVAASGAALLSAASAAGVASLAKLALSALTVKVVTWQPVEVEAIGRAIVRRGFGRTFTTGVSRERYPWTGVYLIFHKFMPIVCRHNENTQEVMEQYWIYALSKNTVDDFVQSELGGKLKLRVYNIKTRTYCYMRPMCSPRAWQAVLADHVVNVVNAVNAGTRAKFDGLGAIGFIGQSTTPPQSDEAVFGAAGCSVLLWGPPGVGKSAFGEIVYQRLVDSAPTRAEKNKILLVNGLDFDDRSFGSIAKLAEDFVVVVVLNEIDLLAGQCREKKGPATTQALLQFLDDINRIDNVVFVCTTNADVPAMMSDPEFERVFRKGRFNIRAGITSPHMEFREDMLV